MKAILFLGVVLLAVLVLGCTGGQQQTAENQSTGSGERIAEEVAAPLYVAPLDNSKIKMTCATDSDCKLIKYKTGSGNVEKCVADNSVYVGVDSTSCYCKSMGIITILENNTEKQVERFECAHVA
jgi:hypothetical protein